MWFTCLFNPLYQIILMFLQFIIDRHNSNILKINIYYIQGLVQLNISDNAQVYQALNEINIYLLKSRVWFLLFNFLVKLLHKFRLWHKWNMVIVILYLTSRRFYFKSCSWNASQITCEVKNINSNHMQINYLK